MIICSFCNNKIGFGKAIVLKTPSKKIALCPECNKSVTYIINSWKQIGDTLERNKRMNKFLNISDYPKDVKNVMVYITTMDIKRRERFVDIYVLDNKEALGYDPFSKPFVRFKQTNDKLYYFGDKPGKYYKLVAFNFKPVYETTAVISPSRATTITKNKGGLGGAVVGGLLTGSVFGAALGYGLANKQVSRTFVSSPSVQNVTEEKMGEAKLTLKEMTTNKVFTISIKCDSKIRRQFEWFKY